MFVYASSVNNINNAGSNGKTTETQASGVKVKETAPAPPVDTKNGIKSKSSNPPTTTTTTTNTTAVTTTINSKKSKKKGAAKAGVKTTVAAVEDPFDGVPTNSEKILKESAPFDLDYSEDSISNSQINEFSLTQSPNNALITGIRGCGKSHLMMTAAAFLTARNMSDLYRIICIGDCRAWAQSDNPVAFFSLEMMMAFRTAAERNASFNPNPLHPHNTQHQNTIEEGNYTPPGIFTSFDDLKSWMEAVGKRLKIHEDLKLVIFIDQLEELYPTNGSVTSNTKMAARIFEMLISLKYPVLITSIIPSPHVRTAMPSALKDPAQFAEMRMPAVLTYSDFDMFVEVFEASRKFTNDDDPLMHDLRMWTGGVPAQIAKFFTSSLSTSNNATNTLNVATRLVRYRTERSKAFSELVLSAAAKMDRLPRMHFLLQLCRMILHIPSDDPQLSPGAAINGLESLFLPAAIQKFYHPEEGIVAYRRIPTAVSPAAYYALCDRKLLTKLAAKWEQVLEAVLASTMNSANICDESKRRIIRFYAQFKLFGISFDEELTVSTGSATTNNAAPASATSTAANSKPIDSNIPVEMRFSGTNQFKDRVTFSLPTKKVRRVIFAGLSPTPILIPSGKNSPNLTCPLVFIPGRTDFCFYDLFVAMPTEKILYAITSCPFEIMMGSNNNSSNNNSNTSNGSQMTTNSSTFNTATNAPLTPFTLLEMWAKDLKDAGYNKFTIKPVYIPPNELLAQVKY